MQQSPFWLSPSFTGDKFRLDDKIFQYDTQLGSLSERSDPADFFRPYFEYFDKRGPPYTCHLGKYMPPSFGELQRLRRMYPKYDEWMQLRAKLDPNQIFVTPYWRKHFLIPTPSDHGQLTLYPKWGCRMAIDCKSVITNFGA
jgi:D-arabinono-1,4-lactone oxidase